MVHPNFSREVENLEELKNTFSTNHEIISDKNQKDFLLMHVNLIKEVILEFENVLGINPKNIKMLEKWAYEFLDNYDFKIRDMRKRSDIVYEKYLVLRELLSDLNIEESKKKIILNYFRNSDGLLIGKLIFAYRENWFLAKHVKFSEFQFGTISEYETWVEENLEKLKKIHEGMKEIFNQSSGKKDKTL